MRKTELKNNYKLAIKHIRNLFTQLLGFFYILYAFKIVNRKFQNKKPNKINVRNNERFCFKSHLTVYKRFT